MKCSRTLVSALFGLATACASASAPLGAQQCVTQSQMQPADKTAIVAASMALATDMQRDDTAAVRARTIPQYASDFDGIARGIHSTAPHLAGATFAPNSVWVLDASRNSNGSDGSPQDTQFFCNLNKGTGETSFFIHSLPQGRYALAVLDSNRATDPWQIAMLLRQDASGAWLLAGVFPRATTAAGHDGLWYWRNARAAAANRQPWVSWLDYREAEQLLRPTGFTGSSHLDQLREEQSKAAPPALSSGIGRDTPLVVRGKDGKEYLLTALAPDASLGADHIDLAMHYTADPLSDPAAARARNRSAAAALADSYPELREHFRRVLIFAESGTGSLFSSEETLNQLP